MTCLRNNNIFHSIILFMFIHNIKSYKNTNIFTKRSKLNKCELVWLKHIHILWHGYHWKRVCFHLAVRDCNYTVFFYRFQGWLTQFFHQLFTLKLLLLQSSKQQHCISENILFLFHIRKRYRFQMRCRWINDVRIFILGWTIPLWMVMKPALQFAICLTWQ